MFNFYFRNEEELRAKLGYVPSSHALVCVFYEGEELVVRTKALGEDYRFVSLGLDYRTTKSVVDSYFKQLQFIFKDTD